MQNRSCSRSRRPPSSKKSVMEQRPTSSVSVCSHAAKVMKSPTRGTHASNPAIDAEAGDKKPQVPKASDDKTIPNGGLVAWLQVVGAFFLLFNSWGIINTFGSYQAYYQTDLLKTSSPSAISWIGSIQGFLLLIVGALTGPIYDAGYFRALLVVGSFLIVFGQVMISLCTAYWQILLAQAFCIGCGIGCLFIPSMAILSTYFSTKVGMAIGIAASGSSFGGVIYPIVFHKLLPRIGFPWTTRVLGFLMLGTILIPNAVMRIRVLPAQQRSLVDFQAFKLPSYTLQALGIAVGSMGLYMPFFFSQLYALEEHITNPNMAFYLLSILNSTSVLGRIIPNIVADKIGPFNSLIPCTLAAAIICTCYTAAYSSTRVIVLMAFFGFFSGSFVSLPATVVVQLSVNARDKIGTRMGQSFAVVAVGVLIGSPIGGAILDAYGFTALWSYGGCMLFASTVLLMLARGLWRGWSPYAKA